MGVVQFPHVPFPRLLQSRGAIERERDACIDERAVRTCVEQLLGLLYHPELLEDDLGKQRVVQPMQAHIHHHHAVLGRCILKYDVFV